MVYTTRVPPIYVDNIWLFSIAMENGPFIYIIYHDYVPFKIGVFFHSYVSLPKGGSFHSQLHHIL